MTASEPLAQALPALEEIQQGWNELTLRVRQLEAEKAALHQDNKALHFLLERVIEHRQKSHGELVLLLTSLVSKLPISEVGVMVSKLVEHNTNVSEVLTALVKGTAEATSLPELTVLKTLDQTKRDLRTALKPAVDELVATQPPLENELVHSLIEQPELFFSPRMVRANRAFAKGQVPRERIVREFGERALAFFNDMTTDAKRNPSPKPEEIALAFKSNFETLLEQDTNLPAEKKPELLALFKKVQQSKETSEQARLQKAAVAKVSFTIELLNYYEHEATEAPDVIFAQRLPTQIEQLVLSGPPGALEEKFVAQAESLIGLVVNSDHRQMVVNNLGKGSAPGKILKYILKLRDAKLADPVPVAAEFVRALIAPPPEKPPPVERVASVLRLVSPEMQRLVVRAVISCDRLRTADAESLSKGLASALDIKDLDDSAKTAANLAPETERQMAWTKIQDLIRNRADPKTLASAIRDRLHAKYDAEEIKQSWVTLIEADPLSLIRVFCQLPYLPTGKTDPIAQTIMESYVTRLTHEKYAGAYTKVVTSLKNMFKVKPDSPTLLNFMALVRWASSEAADKLSHDIGMPGHS